MLDTINSRKEYLHKDLWVIKDFLNSEEIDWIRSEAENTNGWYTTARSPYCGNVKNKFLGYVPEYMSCGTMKLPIGRRSPEDPDGAVFINTPLLYGAGSINDRMRPLNLNTPGMGGLQSFFYVSEEDILKSDLGEDPIVNNYAYPWHSEDVPKGNMRLQRGNVYVYINDDFEGGELRVKTIPSTSWGNMREEDSDLVIVPKPGLMVYLPATKEYTHKVHRVTKGNRHSLYTTDWVSMEYIEISTNDTC